MSSHGSGAGHVRGSVASMQRGGREERGTCAGSLTVHGWRKEEERDTVRLTGGSHVEFFFFPNFPDFLRSSLFLI